MPRKSKYCWVLPVGKSVLHLGRGGWTSSAPPLSFCSSLPFNLCLTNVRVIKEGSAPQDRVKDLCWWHRGLLEVPVCHGRGQHPARQWHLGHLCSPCSIRGTQQLPQHGNAPVPREFFTHECSPALWDGWGGARKEVQARGESPARHTLSSTSPGGVCEAAPLPACSWRDQGPRPALGAATEATSGWC